MNIILGYHSNQPHTCVYLSQNHFSSSKADFCTEEGGEQRRGEKILMIRTHREPARPTENGVIFKESHGTSFPCFAKLLFNIGTRGQQRVMEALQKKAAKLGTVLEIYNRCPQAFQTSNPVHPVVVFHLCYNSKSTFQSVGGAEGGDSRGKRGEEGSMGGEAQTP
ncbi:hypothetical protein VP01_682g2 [Puccinia sorghi]|uniref:Uncharacterized protein n=1 Tax=Puccinia sorghi TaxID=27349 RepID=A0A0L6UFA3_9BASI|nr:hypothetical protein VP01_682g2 [Puccinia sorghi]